MSANNNDQANGIITPKPDLGPVDKLQNFATDALHYVVRLYFTVLLLIYFWFVKIFARALQPLEPVFEQMYKIPQNDATTAGIRTQFIQLVASIFLYIAPLVRKVIGVATRPLAWARDKVIEYVDDSDRETSNKTNLKSR